MKSNVIALIAVVAIAVVAVAAGASMMTNQDDGPGMTDARDRVVQVPDQIDGILCMNCCTLELVSYFDSFGKVCAIDVKDTDNAGKTYYQVNKEFIQSLPTIPEEPESVKSLQTKPSIIFTSTTNVSALDDFQAKTGIPVFAINADIEFGDEKWFEQVLTLGKVLKEEDRAAEIVNGVKRILSLIQANEKDLYGYACGMMFYNAGSDKFLRASGDWLPFDCSGLRNIVAHGASGVEGQPYDIDAELIKSNATKIDFIFIDGTNVKGTVADMERFIENNPSVADKAAFLNGDVYSVMTYKQWGTQFDATLINCAYVCGIVEDWSEGVFEEFADEILKLFYGEGVTLQTVKGFQPDSLERILI